MELELLSPEPELKRLFNERIQHYHTIKSLEELSEALDHLKKYNRENTAKKHLTIIDTQSQAKITQKQTIQEINQNYDKLKQLDEKREKLIKHLPRKK